MRKLQSSDIFSACRVLSAIGIREEFKSIAEKVQSTNRMEAGYELIFALFEKATSSKAEEEWYKFFGNILEIEPNEVKVMDPCKLLDSILEVADVQQWRDFFSRVLSLMKAK